MSTQPTPQSTNTATSSAVSRSQPPITTPSFNYFFRHCYSQLKAWPELIDRNSLSRPGSLSEAYSRLHHNLSYFRLNYVTVTTITLALSLLTHPFSLAILCLLSYGIILCLFHPLDDQPLVLFGRTFSNSEIHGLLLIFTLYLTTSVGTLLISGLMVGFAVVCAHGAFRVLPTDAYDQEPRDADFDTNLISVPDAESNTNLVSEPNVISSSSSSSPPTKYDVFLSFRGKDTRHSFTSHLYAELCRKNIQTYIDDKLDRGENISPALQTAIEESMIYVIIFSENYASSRWCLDELTSILECKEQYGRTVIPIFYDVDPFVIRYQRGSYGDAFVKHEGRYNMDKVQGWKAALTYAAGFSGWNSNTIRPESALVSEIVKDVLRRLNSYYSSNYQGLIGIHKHIAQIQSLMHVESAAVRVTGIWGIGGIGKTTIASAIYHRLASQFSSCSFIVDFKEEIIKCGGIRRMHSKYLPELLDEKHVVDYRECLNQSLNRMKMLLILDNVNNSVQLNDLIGGHGSFDPGSRIIVISRDQQVLKNAKADEIYEVKEMNFQDSIQLFSLNAFKQSYPLETYMDLTEKVLNYAKGSPLALKVLGLLLYGRTREEWESELQKLEKRPNIETLNVLKLSYDGLDDEQKDIFLHIACFYRGHDMNTVKQVLDDYGLSAAIGMRILVDRGLISIFNGVIMMHDLIQELGQEIVRQQCVNEPGKRSRLWKPVDIYQVLKKKKGTDAIQCIFLEICKIEKVQLHDETFKMMHNLRLLQFYKSSSWEYSKVYIPEFLEFLQHELKLNAQRTLLQIQETGKIWHSLYCSKHAPLHAIP